MSSPTILFDLDGTLIHSAPDVCHAVNYAMESEGFPLLTVEQVQGYLGFGARILIERALSREGHQSAEEIIDRVTDSFLASYRANPVIDTAVFPGVLDALAGLRRRDAQLAICTNKPAITCGPVLQVLGLDQMFDAIVCGDQVANKKPHGDHIRETVVACAGDLGRAIMIGDSENDIGAAKDAGIPSIAVSFGYAAGSPGDLGANAVIDHFDQLIETIDRIAPNL